MAQRNKDERRLLHDHEFTDHRYSTKANRTKRKKMRRAMKRTTKASAMRIAWQDYLDEFYGDDLDSIG